MGGEYAYEIKLFAKDPAGEILVTENLSEGIEFVSSTPAASSVKGNVVKWDIGSMSENEKKTIKVVTKVVAEGKLKSCATVSALPRSCMAVVVGSPKLIIKKTGPEYAALGTNVPYNITVTNKGTSVAKNVVVTDVVPAGMSAVSKTKFDFGNIEPGKSKEVTVTLKADKRGTHTNKAVADSANAGKVSDTAKTIVQKSGLTITKSGTKTQFLGKIAKYNIVVKNVGDVTLKDVLVTDNAPQGTMIKSAPGAEVRGLVATWKISSLAAGASKSFSVELASATAGTLTNKASATAAGLTANTEAPTLWKGYSALLLEVIDTEDPLLVGQSTSYVIKVSNQGTAADSNIKVEAVLPDEMDYVSADGDGSFKVMGKTVTFSLPKLDAKKVSTFHINVKASATGDSRIGVGMTSARIIKPVSETESTNIY
jgi:uncharacterized repeat protein (TIGR01451 family)